MVEEMLVNGSIASIDFGYHKLQVRLFMFFKKPYPHFDILNIISEDV